jgi:hypothetical protein
MILEREYIARMPRYQRHEFKKELHITHVIVLILCRSNLMFIYHASGRKEKNSRAIPHIYVYIV